jgi:O-antigen/teichoic acid export membrane protein
MRARSRRRAGSRSACDDACTVVEAIRGQGALRGGQETTVTQDEIAARLGRDIPSLRTHTARGTMVNSAFQIGLSGLSVLQRLVVAAFLTRSEVGIWGLVLTTVVTLAFLKDLGIADKYIQQSEPDQEIAFQKAFTLELFSGMAFFLLVALALPVFAVVYGHSEIILPGIVATVAVPIMAFESAAWVPYRRLQYTRQRFLTAVDPLVTFAVTVAMAVAGAGYWCFVGGILAGSLSGALVCTVTSPYPLRLRLDRDTIRQYASFSGPLVGAGVSTLLIVQGSTIAAAHVVGVAGVGAIVLATGIATFAERVDGIVSQTIYPAVCAVVDRRELLAEIFVKTNRVALMWAMPFGVGLALFSDDLVHFVLGERWRAAAGLIAAFGLTCAVGQVGFNWPIFQRALNDTRPLLIGSLISVAEALVVWLPLIIAFGLTGFAAGFATSIAVQLVLRGYYLRRLFYGFKILRQLARAMAPTIPAAALVLALRLVTPAGHDLPRTVAILVAYIIAAAAFTVLFERSLVREMVGYLRGRTAVSPVPTVVTPPGRPAGA